jgi:microcompartment protein CcmK/EutM
VIPSIDFSSVREAHWWQFAVRFVLGGAVTACTGLGLNIGSGRRWPLPVLPAIFPASATLIGRHETDKKLKAGIHDSARGRKAAALDAAGAVFGGWGLVCFGFAAWLTLPRYPTAVALALAGIVWVIVSTSLWWLRRHR